MYHWYNEAMFGAARGVAAPCIGQIRRCRVLLAVVIAAVGGAVGPSSPVEAYGVAPWEDTPGPGGGTVYYYNADGFSCGVTLADTCHYLEYTARIVF